MTSDPNITISVVQTTGIIMVALFQLLAVIFTFKQGQKIAAVADSAKIVAVSVDEKLTAVKEAAEIVAIAVNGKLEKIVVTGEKNHVLVNSNYGAQLKLVEFSALALKKTDPTAENIKAWELAVEAVKKHDANQAIADVIPKAIEAADHA